MKRTDLLLCGVAALLALPVYRGWSWNGGHHPKKPPLLAHDTIVQLAPLEDRFASPSPESDRQVRGQDSFDDNSLRDYTGSSDGDGGGESWAIRGGSLAGIGPARQSV